MAVVLLMVSPLERRGDSLKKEVSSLLLPLFSLNLHPIFFSTLFYFAINKQTEIITCNNLSAGTHDLIESLNSLGEFIPRNSFRFN